MTRRATGSTGTATERVVARGGTTAGTAAQRAGTALARAGEVLEERSTAVAPAVGTAVGSAVETAVDSVSTTVAGLASAVGDFLDEPAVRGGAALDALRGVPVGPPASVRRWPWAFGAALVGAAAGAGVALLVHRLSGADAPGAQEPHELRAVVDLPGEGTTGTTATSTTPSTARAGAPLGASRTASPGPPPA